MWGPRAGAHSVDCQSNAESADEQCLAASTDVVDPDARSDSASGTQMPKQIETAGRDPRKLERQPSSLALAHHT